MWTTACLKKCVLYSEDIMIDNIHLFPELVRMVSEEVHPVSFAAVYGTLNSDIGITAPYGNLHESEMPSERAVIRILRHADELGIKLNTKMPDCTTGDFKPFTAGILLPDTPASIRDEFTASLCRAVKNLGIDVRLVFRYYPPHTDDFFRLLNSMATEKPDIYFVYPIYSKRFRECAAAISSRKPLVLLDGIIMNSDFAQLTDTAYVGPDYYNTGRIAAMALDERLADSDFCAIVTPDPTDAHDMFDNVPLTDGIIDSIRGVRSRENRADIAMFYSGYGINNTTAHLAMSICNYYVKRRDKLNEKALAPDCKVRGVGAVFAHEGVLRLTLETMKRLEESGDRYLAKAKCVGINGSALMLDKSVKKYLSLLVNHDRLEECTKALIVAANRLKNGDFGEKDTLAVFTNCRIYKY